MKEIRFYQVDVFTAKPFCGNPLAVVPDADGLSPAEMKMIAREMSLPETTFIIAPTVRDSLYRMRIFTPTVELPFTGHPAIGAHWVMAQLGRVPLSGPVTTVRYEQGVGALTADFFVESGRVDRIMMSQCPPVVLGEVKSIRDLAEGLGVRPEDITATGMPVQVVSTGMPQIMVPLRSLPVIRRLKAAEMKLPALTRVMENASSTFIMTFTLETENPAAAVHARGFGHLVGIPEDPVTGNANGALGAYLVRNGLIPVTGPTVRYVSEQGREIGRPGTVFVEVDQVEGVPTAVRVGGECVLVMEGVLRL